MVLVDTDAICAAIKDVFEDTRSILEPAGALAVAGAKDGPATSCDKTWWRPNERRQHEFRPPALRRRARRNRRAARSRARRDAAREARRLQKFVSLIGSRNITEFNYRYHDAGRPMSSSASRWPTAPNRALVNNCAPARLSDRST